MFSLFYSCDSLHLDLAIDDESFVAKQDSNSAWTIDFLFCATKKGTIKMSLSTDEKTSTYPHENGFGFKEGRNLKYSISGANIGNSDDFKAMEGKNLAIFIQLELEDKSSALKVFLKPSIDDQSSYKIDKEIYSVLH